MPEIPSISGMQCDIGWNSFFELNIETLSAVATHLSLLFLFASATVGASLCLKLSLQLSCILWWIENSFIPVETLGPMNWKY